MASTPSDIRRPIPRPFLERVSRPLLARLLAPYEPALSESNFPLAALASSAQTDRAHVDTLWHLLGAPPPALVPLSDEVLAIADVATPGGHELLLARDTARVLDPDLGAEDCAATAHLDHRPLFDTARPQTAGQAQTRSFASFQSASPRALPVQREECRAAFQRRMGEELASRGRTAFFKVHEWRSASERHMELVYGRLASARDLLGKKQDGGGHDVTAQVTDRSTERAHAVFHEDMLRFDVAGYDWMKELVRRVFGETHFGSPDHFEGNETITLAPFADIAAALSVEGVPGLKKAELQELWIDLAGSGGAWVAVGARGDCMKAASADYVQRALSDGKAVEATVLLTLTNRTRPVKLKIAPPRRLDFDRRDTRVVRIVRDWVVARGFMSMPDHLRGADAESPDSLRSARGDEHGVS